MRYMVNCDATRYPRTAAYLASLPMGFESFPGCEVHTEMLEYVRATHADVAKLPGLPQAIAMAISPPPKMEWIPDTVGNALYLAIRDSAYKSDEDFLAWHAKSMDAFYQRPLMKLLIKLVSPTLMVMGGAKRWAAAHHGSSLSVEPVRQEGGRRISRVVLVHPPGLFNELRLRMQGKAFEVAVTNARGKDARADLLGNEGGRALFDVSYEA